MGICYKIIYKYSSIIRFKYLIALFLYLHRFLPDKANPGIDNFIGFNMYFCSTVVT